MVMETIGQILKRVREEKGISIEEVSNQTKVHHRVIEALESDNFKELPAPVYVKSFIKHYAKFLELDSEELVKRYMSEYAERPKQVFMLNEIRLGTGELSQYFTPLVTGLIAAMVILLVYSLGQSIVKKTMLSRHTPVSPETEVGTPAVYQPKEPKVTVGPATVSETVETEVAIEETLKPLEEDEGKPVRLKVSVIHDCWLQVKCDGKVVFCGTLKEGTNELWEAEDNISIWTGKAEAMSLELNGRPLGSPGEGVMKEIVVTKEGLK